MRTQGETFIEFADDAFDLHKLDGALVIHVGHLVVAIHAEVGAGNNLPDIEEVGNPVCLQRFLIRGGIPAAKARQGHAERPLYGIVDTL